ncbi:MAG: Rrf2 family transcriptional regulator [Rickettsiales bacterium]|nr:Rrf2 family transcriptional regulator [Rickettsiales bacterium]
MLRLSKKMYYAVEAVLYIAYNAKSDPISSREIADRQGLPPRYLEQIMQRLVRAGILRGMRGPKGGYVLARERRRINVREICEVVRDMDEVSAEELQKTDIASHVISPLCDEINAEMYERLESICMATLCDQAKAKQVRREDETPMDFTI